MTVSNKSAALLFQGMRVILNVWERTGKDDERTVKICLDNEVGTEQQVRQLLELAKETFPEEEKAEVHN